MRLTIVGGTANPSLTEAIATGLGGRPGRRELRRFPDGELRVVLDESVRGHDVYLIQPTGPPVAEHLFELLLLADAARRAGAARVTAVMPYFGYARQDRRADGRSPVGARLVADLIAASAIARVVAVDVHTAAIEGFFPIPVEHVSAVPALASAAQAWAREAGVVVAPDLGAAKLAERYATILNLPVAIVHKVRQSGETVSVRRMTGDVRQRAPIIVDDMISTGGTIVAAVEALLAADCRPEIVVVATHGLLVGQATERLAGLPIRQLIVTDSVPPPAEPRVPRQIVRLGPLLADVIGRLHEDRSLEDLIVHE